MITYSQAFNARKRGLGAGGDLKKSEVGGAASNIDHQDMLKGSSGKQFCLSILSCLTLEPPVKSGLRFFQQADACGKTRLIRSV